MCTEAINKFRNDWLSAMLSVFRIIVGYMFLLHGLQKFGILNGAWKVPAGMMLAAGVIEVVGGLFILLGLFISWVAFITAGQMAVAYWMSHAGSNLVGSWNPLANKGELAVFYCFAFLLLFFLGGGKWSLDAIVCKKK